MIINTQINEIDLLTNNHGTLLTPNFIEKDFCFIGLGHGLSQIIMVLTKLGMFNAYFIDGDFIQRKNIVNTVYAKGAISNKKSYIMPQIMKAQSVHENPNFIGIKEYIHDNSLLPPADIFVIGTDTGKSRYNIFKAIMKNIETYKGIQDYDPIFVDVRFKFSEFMGMIANIGTAKKLILQDLNAIKHVVDDVHNCNERSNPIAIHLAGSFVSKLILDFLRKDYGYNMVWFGGNSETFETNKIEVLPK